MNEFSMRMHKTHNRRFRLLSPTKCTTLRRLTISLIFRQGISYVYLFVYSVWFFASHFASSSEWQCAIDFAWLWVCVCVCCPADQLDSCQQNERMYYQSSYIFMSHNYVSCKWCTVSEPSTMIKSSAETIRHMIFRSLLVPMLMCQLLNCVQYIKILIRKSRLSVAMRAFTAS